MLRSLLVRWRRWRVLRSYSRIYAARTGKSVGLSPSMAALAHAARDGVISLDDGSITWHDDRLQFDGGDR